MQRRLFSEPGVLFSLVRFLVQTWTPITHSVVRSVVLLSRSLGVLESGRSLKSSFGFCVSCHKGVPWINVVAVMITYHTMQIIYRSSCTSVYRYLV